MTTVTKSHKITAGLILVGSLVTPAVIAWRKGQDTAKIFMAVGLGLLIGVALIAVGWAITGTIQKAAQSAATQDQTTQPDTDSN